MSLYTLKELNNKPADIIRTLILEGYKIVPTEQTNNKKEFVAVLINGNYTVKVITRYSYDYFVIIFTAEHKTDHKFDLEESHIYYKSYSDKYGEVYSDSEKEAEDERIKYLSKCYEDLYLAGKYPEIHREIKFK
jgi:hypothetical protein